MVVRNTNMVRIDWQVPGSESAAFRGIILVPCSVPRFYTLRAPEPADLAHGFAVIAQTAIAPVHRHVFQRCSKTFGHTAPAEQYPTASGAANAIVTGVAEH